jgi:hypothetical protein
MWVDLHATLVLGAVVVPLIVAALSPGWRARAVRDTVIAVLPIAAVGVLFLCLLSAAGIPIAPCVLFALSRREGQPFPERPNVIGQAGGHGGSPL